MPDLGHKSAPSVFVSESDYQILTLKFLKLDKDGLNDDAYSFVFSENNEVYLVDDKHKFELVNNTESYYDKLVALVNYAFSIVKYYTAEADNLEDSLFDRNIPRFFMEMWFSQKRDFLKQERNMLRISEVLIEFDKKNPSFWSEYKTEYKDLKEDIEILKRSIKSQLTKLDNLFSYYNSIKNDHLNKNIYLLALISGIFLPLNLIVGFFGMNTSDMFLTKELNGTQVVLTWLAGLFVLLILGLPVMRMLDRFLFSRFLGDSHYYKRMSTKLEKFAEDFNI